jgi:DNA repair exonuclease SbcCD ATPase subunit
VEAKKAQAVKRRQKLEAEIDRVQSEKNEEEAKDSEDPALALVSVTQMIEGEIKTKEATVEKLRDSQLIKLEEDLERQKEEADKANIECKAAEIELSKVQEEMSLLKQDNDGVMSRQVELTQKLSTLEKKIVARKKERDAAEAEAAECKKTLEQMLQLAIQPEIPPEEFAHGGNLKELCKELEKKRKQLADGERHQRKSTAAIMSHYLTLKAHKDARKQKLKATKEMINFIRGNLQQRRKSFKSRRDLVGKAISGAFTGFLEVKKFSGCLEFDHKERTMRPIVKTESNKNVNLRRDDDGGTKALSGGEKSYTSLCLVMALSGGEFGNPLVAMDEFDVSTALPWSHLFRWQSPPCHSQTFDES